MHLHTYTDEEFRRYVKWPPKANRFTGRKLGFIG